MAQWAIKKGIDLLATADWTHPLWLKELESCLEEENDGIFQLKSNVNLSANGQDGQLSKVNYVLSTEISSIYSQGSKTRRIHNVVIAPSFSVVHKINDQLKKRGCNLMSDGRPIIGLSSIELAELVWSIDERVLIIPAHIWTPWFSMFGSKSGFDSIDECWGRFKDNIYAIETGLSSDPAMNWKVSELDSRSIVSFSDAHSPAKLGRELTVFELEELSFSAIANALRSRASGARPGAGSKAEKQVKNRILYTVEFYPEEGKYHYTGHRNCGIKQSPGETKKKGATCPVCGKPLTLGVMHRVQQLAGREIKTEKKEGKAGLTGYYNADDKNRPPYVMFVPLIEILAESLETGPSSQKALGEYEKLINAFGSELIVLTEAEIGKIGALSGARAGEGIKKVRKGDIVVEPGFDGVFGTVKIWPEGEDPEKNTEALAEQETLF